MTTETVVSSPFGSGPDPDAALGPWVDPTALLGAAARGHYYPRYRTGRWGDWSVQAVMMAAARGYWGEVQRLDGTIILSGPSENGAQSWMSLTPSEIESQEIGLAAARGHTVVMGMGMGWLAANVALKPEVERMTVVERDPQILKLINDQGIIAALPEAVRDKVEIVCADALTWKPEGAVDSLQADIWRPICDDRKLGDVRRMQENVRAEALYFWGQESEIWRFACRRAGGEPTLTWDEVRRIVADDIGLPLVLPDWPDYPEKIAAGAPWWTPKRPGWWRETTEDSRS